MENNTSYTVKVGIFFTIAVVIIMGLSLQIADRSLFERDYEIIANFQQAHAIDQGTRVTLRGVNVGKVKSLDWDPTRYRVRVVLQIKERYHIPRNAVARVQISTLLGANLINIAVEEGPEEPVYLVHGDEIVTEETMTMNEVMLSFGKLTDDAESLITNLDRNQQETLRKIQDVIEENRADLRESSESFARLGPRLETLADRLNEMTESVQRGEGTMGALFADSSLYDDLKEFSSLAREVGDQIRSGEGTIGQLIYGDELTTDARQVMEDLQRAAREVEAAIGENREGMRTLIASVSDSTPRIEEAVLEINEITRKINSGEGTLGRLVNDPSLYEDAQRTVNQVGESFESAEEQGVFRSFLGLLFGALI